MANVAVDEDQQWLINCLSATFDPNQEVRSFAEASLDQAALQPAALILKRFIKKHWQEDDESFQQPAVSSDEKAVIRRLLLSTLDDPSRKLCTAISMAIASIAVYDWPESWPDLLDFLLKLIADQSVLNGVKKSSFLHGGLRCLALLSGDLDDTIIPTLVPVLFPRLYTIVSSAQTYNKYLCTKALSIVYVCTSMLGAMSGVHQVEANALMEPMLKPWVDQFSLILEHPVQPEDPDDWSTRTEDPYEGSYDSDGAEKSLDSFVIQEGRCLIEESDNGLTKSGDWRKSGVGGLLRVEDGSVMYSFQEAAGPCPPLLIELKTIKKGLIFFDSIKQLFKERLIVESDSKLAVDWVKNNDCCPYVYIDLVKDIVARLRYLEGVIRWVARESLFEFLLTIVGSTKLVKVVANNIAELVYYTCFSASYRTTGLFSLHFFYPFRVLISLLLSFMKLVEMPVYWSSFTVDANQFVADEDDVTYSCRVSGVLLLEEVATSCGEVGIDAIISAAGKRFSESQQEKAGGSVVWWRVPRRTSEGGKECLRILFHNEITPSTTQTITKTPPTILLTTHQFVQHFPSFTESLFMVIVAPLWQTFVSSLRVYTRSVIEGSYDSLQTAQLVEHKVINLELFEFLLTIVGSTKLVKVVANNIAELVYYTIAFLQVTEQQLPTCKGVWLGFAPPRVEAFLWQLAHQKVAVKTELVKRGLSLRDDILCPFSGTYHSLYPKTLLLFFVPGMGFLYQNPKNVMSYDGFPPVDFLKMNVDGAIRRDGTPLAELKAIKSGIEIFLSSRWESVGRLIVESDCESAVEWIQAPSLAHVFFSSIVFQISTLITGKVHSLRLIARACNGEADNLAKNGIG
ncbi:importin-9-like isoform X2 [Hibiscus syriacus]|uniref:Importin-9-like isoform X2 n=1 Tax=Hibiscus syriacus TaxID=106335 RepID=A0A6A2WFK5_HIBSY|nr:importin-9-like isoform X2 [Hibiscus syriacus]